MSTRGEEWLRLGIATARGQRERDKAEAREYLERALDSNLALEQQPEAYYWLSRVTDDPVKKRDYLEHVLAFLPSHPEARRELAILNGNLKPADIVDTTMPLKPVETTARVQASERRRAVCPQCGGKLNYDADKKALRCAYCGYRQSEYEALMDSSGMEQDFLLTLPTARAHRWELPTARLLSCQSCGASFTLPPSQASATCPFCASAYVVESSAQNELLAPDAVLPFRFKYDEAVKHVRHWLQAQKFAPHDLAKRSAIVKPRPIYLPCWTFDISGEVKWKGLVRVVRHNQFGHFQEEWAPTEGAQMVWHDDMLIPAAHSIPAAYITELLRFDTSALAPYTAELLADVSVEVYQVALADAAVVAHARAFHAAKERVMLGEASEAKEVTYNSLGIFIESYKLMLAPIWITGYRYKGTMYALYLNGQTGEGHGAVPRSGLQKLAAGILGD
jgi:DNA-directed RNA polymerase subunit RPC12/RpoP